MVIRLSLLPFLDNVDVDLHMSEQILVLNETPLSNKN